MNIWKKKVADVNEKLIIIPNVSKSLCEELDGKHVEIDFGGEKKSVCIIWKRKGEDGSEIKIPPDVEVQEIV